VDVIPNWIFAHGSDVGFAGLLTLAIILILTGRLVPRSTVEAREQDWQDRLESKETQVQYLQQANAKLLDTQAVRDAQIGELLEHSRTAAYFIQAVATQGKTEKAP
jgi:hypothetical protein